MKSIRFLSRPTRQRGLLFASVSLFALAALSLIGSAPAASPSLTGSKTARATSTSPQRPSVAAVQAAPAAPAVTAAQAVAVAQPPARAQRSKAAVARPAAVPKARAQARSAATPAATLPSSLDRLRGSAFGTPPFVALDDISCVAPGGLWSSGSTWSGGVVPTGADNVTITNGCTVTIDAAASALNLTVASGGVLQYEDTTARTLTANGNVTVASGGTLQSAATGTQTGHVLLANGHLTNAGTLDFSTNGDTAGAGITFAGAADAVFANSGTLDLRGVTLNKGTSSASTLDFLPGGTITVQGANTAGFLTISNGTFKIGGSSTFTNPVFAAAAYTIPAAGGIWLNNANATIVGQAGSPTNAGSLRLSDGTFGRRHPRYARDGRRQRCVVHRRGRHHERRGSPEQQRHLHHLHPVGRRSEHLRCRRLRHFAVVRLHRRDRRRDEDVGRRDQPGEQQRADDRRLQPERDDGLQRRDAEHRHRGDRRELQLPRAGPDARAS